jgi:hypothetical protein
MSCLYSSPEVTSVELLALKLLAWIVVVIVAWSDPVRVTRTEAQCSSIPHRFCRTSRSTKDAFPNSPADTAGCIKSFRLPKQAQVFSVIFQAQYQAFVRFAVGSSAALSAIALN